MAEVPVPNALRTRTGGWTDPHTQAWNDLIGMLRRGGHTIPDDANLETVQRAYLTSLFRGQAALAGVLANEEQRTRYFNLFFNAFAADRGGAVQLNRDDANSRMPVAPRFRGDTAAGQPNQPLATAIGVPENFRAGQPNRQQEWAQLVTRLRAAGYLTMDNATEHDVRRAFLMSQITPNDPQRAARIEEIGDRDNAALLSQFNTAYGADPTVRSRADGTENRAAPVPPPPAEEAPPPHAPPSLSARYTAMTAALSGIRTTADLTRFNGLLNPSGAFHPGRVRLSGAVARAAQGFAVGAVGGAGHMAREIQRYLTANPNDVPENLRPYVNAVRGQLGTGVQANGPQALARIQGWLADGRAGVTTDLAIMIARNLPTGEGADAPNIITGWAGALGRPGPGRATGVAANQIVAMGENGTVTLTPRAIQLAAPARPPPAATR